MACDPADVISSAELTGLKADIVTIDDVVESFLDTTPTKSGTVVNTLRGQLKLLGYEVPITYAGSIVFATNDNTKTIDRSGVIYAPLPSELPFTTTGTWVADDENKFFVVQGVTSEELEALNRVKSFDTVALAKVDLDLVSGNVLYLSEYATGTGGGAFWGVISGTGTANTFDKVAHDSLSLTLVLIIPIYPTFNMYGATGLGVADDGPAVEFAASSGLTAIYGEDGNDYLCSDMVFSGSDLQMVGCNGKCTITAITSLNSIGVDVTQKLTTFRWGAVQVISDQGASGVSDGNNTIGIIFRNMPFMRILHGFEALYFSDTSCQIIQCVDLHMEQPITVGGLKGLSLIEDTSGPTDIPCTTVVLNQPYCLGGDRGLNSEGTVNLSIVHPITEGCGRKDTVDGSIHIAGGTVTIYDAYWEQSNRDLVAIDALVTQIGHGTTSQGAAITVLDYTKWAGKTITIEGSNVTTTTLTEGIDFDAVTDEDTTAANIALAFTTISGVTGSSLGAIATASPTVADPANYITVFDTNATLGVTEAGLMVAPDVVTWSGTAFDDRGYTRVNTNIITTRNIGPDTIGKYDLTIGENFKAPLNGGSTEFGYNTTSRTAGSLVTATWTAIATLTGQSGAGVENWKSYKYAIRVGQADGDVGFDSGNIMGGVIYSHTGSIPAYMRMTGNDLEVIATGAGNTLTWGLILNDTLPIGVT